MSLEALRQLRRAGKRPAAPVLILLGQRPRWMDDGADVVVVREADQPALMDWRPLLGLCVAVVSLRHDPAQTLAVLDAVQPLAGSFFGAVDASGTYPMLQGADESHHAVLRQTWEALCR